MSYTETSSGFCALLIDTESTCLLQPNINYTRVPSTTRIVSICFQYMRISNDKTLIMKKYYYVIKCDDHGNEFKIPQSSTAIHGITPEDSSKNGVPFGYILPDLYRELKKAYVIVCHNVKFDITLLLSNIYSYGLRCTTNKKKQTVNCTKLIKLIINKKKFCTMESTVKLCKLPFRNSFQPNMYKYPKLSELCNHLGIKIDDVNRLHSAEYDVDLTRQCFIALVKMGLYIHK